MRPSYLVAALAVPHSPLENLFSVALIRKRYGELIAEMISPNTENMLRIRKWRALSHKYVHYFARGGSELLRPAEMRAFDLATLPPLPKGSLPRDVNELQVLAHELNWKVIRSKHLEKDEEPWSAALPPTFS